MYKRHSSMFLPSAGGGVTIVPSAAELETLHWPYGFLLDDGVVFSVHVSTISSPHLGKIDMYLKNL